MKNLKDAQRRADEQHIKQLDDFLREAKILCVFNDCFYVMDYVREDFKPRFYRVDVDLSNANIVELDRK